MTHQPIISESLTKLAFGIRKLKPIIQIHGNMVDEMCFEQGLIEPHAQLTDMVTGDVQDLELSLFQILNEMRVPFDRLHNLVKETDDNLNLAILQRGMREPMEQLKSIFKDGFDVYLREYNEAQEAKRKRWNGP